MFSDIFLVLKSLLPHFSFPPLKPPPGFMNTRDVIPGVVEPDGNARTYTPESWITEIMRYPPHPDRLKELESCIVTEVHHYRENKAGMAHEFILCIVKSRRDTRFIYVHRAPQNNEPSNASDQKQLGLENSSAKANSQFKLMTGFNSYNTDRIQITDGLDLKEILKKNTLVQRVELVPNVNNTRDAGNADDTDSAGKAHSVDKADNAGKADSVDKADDVDKAESVDKVDKPDDADKADDPDDADKADDPDDPDGANNARNANRPMTVLDVAALARTISTSAINYSLYHHMCWWSSANFFQTVVQTWNLQVIQGDAYNKRGCIFGYPMVAPDTCRILLPQSPHFDEILRDLERDLREDQTNGEADGSAEDRARNIMQTMRQESIDIQADPDRNDLETMRTRFNRYRRKLRRDIRNNKDVLTQTREDKKRAEESQKRTEERMERMEEEHKKDKEESEKKLAALLDRMKILESQIESSHS
ncbi:hypothetical protein EV360DRAFT_72407 [Lentinula raphanica]|nr:hypothetical protein EV360DRAFT_72407 [Lentinula raphanica]